MYEVFTKLLNMSLTAGILVLFVIFLRLVLKKAPKKYICILWALVAVRLILPFSISSSVSAYNVLQQDTISSGQVEYFEYNGKTEKPLLSFEVPTLVNDDYAPNSMTFGTKSSGIYMPTVVYIWIFGVIVMFSYAAVSYFKLHREVRASIKEAENIFVCDEITSPFILSIIHPRIYIPSGIGEDIRENVIAHEQAHIKRLDYIWKPLGYVLLSVYWFNPLMWVAYIFLCKDIEAACDEKVISQMDTERVAGYSQALLACAAQRRMITACPLAFGETDVKGRIKNVLNYKKPAFWIVSLSLIICIVVAVCFLTNPQKKENNTVEYGLYTCCDDNDKPMERMSGLLINDDGTFSFSPGLISSYLGVGTWEMSGDYVTFSDTGMGDVRKSVFQYVDGKLYYVADKSAINSMWGLSDGAELVYQNNTTLLEYLTDNYSIDTNDENDTTTLSSEVEWSFLEGSGGWHQRVTDEHLAQAQYLFDIGLDKALESHCVLLYKDEERDFALYYSFKSYQYEDYEEVLIVSNGKRTVVKAYGAWDRTDLRKVASACDLDGDGFEEIIIPLVTETGTGYFRSSFIIFDSSDGATYDMSSVCGADEIVFREENYSIVYLQDVSVSVDANDGKVLFKQGDEIKYEGHIKGLLSSGLDISKARWADFVNALQTEEGKLMFVADPCFYGEDFFEGAYVAPNDSDNDVCNIIYEVEYLADGTFRCVSVSFEKY